MDLPRTLRAQILPVLLGILVGATVYAVIPIWFSFVSLQLPGSFNWHPLNLVMLTGLAVCAVVAGTRWPVLGISAGLLILTVATRAALIGSIWMGLESLWDIRGMMSFGGTSAYPAMIGVTFVTTAILSLRARSSVSRPQL